MFELDPWLEECIANGHDPAAIELLVARAVRRPEQLARTLNPPERGGLQVLHRSEHLTVLHITWAAHAVMKPHEHGTWAVIGVYAGREDSLRWRRGQPDEAGLVVVGGSSAGPGAVVSLAPDAIHSVTNPVAGPTSALHVYGGDFFALPRKEWDPATLRERPYDVEATLQLIDRESSGSDYIDATSSRTPGSAA